MNEITSAPDVSDMDVPIDAWTEPFWRAAADGRLLLVRCGDCRRHRWPPGPFCPHCQSQSTEWTPAGRARIYSFTVVREPVAPGETPRVHVPALVEFPDADGVRLIAPIVDAPIEAVRIGAEVTVVWSPAGNVRMPAFRLA